MNNKIKEYRKQKKLKLEDLSKLTGLSKGYICHLEKGTRNNPSKQTMDLLSSALEKNINDIFYN